MFEYPNTGRLACNFQEISSLREHTSKTGKELRNCSMVKELS